MILDANTLLAYFDRSNERHWAMAGQIELRAAFEPLVVSPFVVTELEALVRARHGVEGWLSFLTNWRAARGRSRPPIRRT